MLLSDLSQEIIDRVAILLSTKDKGSCYLACKAWYKAFQGSIHSDININFKSTIRNIEYKHWNSQYRYREFGHLVRIIHVTYSLKIADREIHILQNAFPNVKYLYFSMDSISPVRFGMTSDWNIWRSLIELRLYLDYSLESDGDVLVKTILCLPLLRWLEIINPNWRSFTTGFSLNDFERIHSHLKYLGHLKLHTNILAFSKTDVERMTNVSLATNMESLNIQSKKTDHRWLCYFARKYPNLHTLEFTTETNFSDNEEQRDNAVALFQQVPLPFKRLKKVELEYYDCVGNEHLLFWNMINCYSIPLKHISVYIAPEPGIYSPDNLFDIPKRTAEICLPNFSKTIESFRLGTKELNITLVDFIEIKDTLYNLVKLEISMSTVPIEIDGLLCAAPRLKSLGLKYLDVKVKDELYNSKRFGLLYFKGYCINLSSDALRFLSFHCRDLHDLCLTESSVHGNFTTPGCQFIDMTYSRFTTLDLYKTHFIIKDNKECPENLNIVLFTRPINDIPSKQDYDPKVSPVVFGAPIKAHYGWFYTDKKKNVANLPKVLRSRVEKFALNYEENKRIAMEKAVYIKRKKLVDQWKESLVFGYTKIKVGYVTNYNIRGSMY